MKYYKIIDNNQIIGVVSSKAFVQYIPVAECFARCNETKGEYISYSNHLYRDNWMSPTKANIEFIQAYIVNINKDEYDTLYDAFKNNEQLVIEDNTQREDIIQPVIVDPSEEVTIDFIRQSKISEMSYECRKAIEAGTDVIIRGQVRHFSMTQQDQLNFISLGTLAQTQDLIPYHADGESCVFYTANEISQIISATTAHKIYQTTYYNALKDYINSLETIEEIAAITYGTPIPDEYQSEVLKVITQ